MTELQILIISINSSEGETLAGIEPNTFQQYQKFSQLNENVNAVNVRNEECF